MFTQSLASIAKRSVSKRCRRPLFVGLVLLPLSFGAAAAHADWFGSGDNRFEIPMVTIGSPGNVADTTGAPNPAGRVDYTYRIGQFEVPEEAVRKANAQSALDGTPLGLTLDERGPQKPATGLSWFEAARFANWLNEDAGAAPAYKFDDGPQGNGVFQLWTPTDPGYNAANPFRNTLARYVLPSVDEWYKAAFYDPAIDAYWDYPTGSDEPPTPVASGTDPGTAVWNQTGGPADVRLAGGASPFWTVGQGGNVIEWEETAEDLVNDEAGERRGGRGGSHILSLTPLNLASTFRNATFADASPSRGGIRIVSVPEPSALAAATVGLFSLLRIRQPFLATSNEEASI